MHQRGEVWSDAATCAPSEAHFCFCLFCSQRGKEEYKLAATSDGEAKKAKKGKGKKDVDDLKKEVDLVSRRAQAQQACSQLEWDNFVKSPHYHEKARRSVLMRSQLRQSSSLVTWVCLLSHFNDCCLRSSQPLARVITALLKSRSRLYPHVCLYFL